MDKILLVALSFVSALLFFGLIAAFLVIRNQARVINHLRQINAHIGEELQETQTALQEMQKTNEVMAGITILPDAALDQGQNPEITILPDPEITILPDPPEPPEPEIAILEE